MGLLATDTKQDQILGKLSSLVDTLHPFARVVGSAVVKTGAGSVHRVIVAPTGSAVTAGTLAIYDGTTNAGLPILSVYLPASVFAPFTLVLNESFNTGLFVEFAGLTGVNANVSYV